MTIPSAATGLDVTGVDLARPMLEHVAKKAEAQNPKIRWMEANAFDLGLKYAFIYLTRNAFQTFLRREDQEALLASVKRHLAPHGIFAFETRNLSGHALGAIWRLGSRKTLSGQPQHHFDLQAAMIQSAGRN